MQMQITVVKWVAFAALAIIAMGMCAVDANIDVCRVFPNNTLVRDPDSCGSYLHCIDFVGVRHTCDSSKPFFDKAKGECVKTATDNSTCELSCTDHEYGFIADPKSCVGYYYCLGDAIAMWGQCPDGMHFEPLTETCIYKSTSNCTVADLDYCSIVKDSVNFNDESSCDRYFSCKKGVLTSSTCKNSKPDKDMYYDAVSGTCKAKSLVQCDAHPYPDKVCGTAAKPTTKLYVADGATCRGYFYCGKMYTETPQWRQCPGDTFFSESSQACVKPTDAQCDWDRCDGRSLTFVSSATKGCRYYLRCLNGVTLEELTCGNYFFDEDKGVCTSSIVLYPSCS